jgi:hypothetical protein
LWRFSRQVGEQRAGSERAVGGEGALGEVGGVRVLLVRPDGRVARVDGAAQRCVIALLFFFDSITKYIAEFIFMKFFIKSHIQEKLKYYFSFSYIYPLILTLTTQSHQKIRFLEIFF